MQGADWIFAFASAIGNGHLANQLPCQDSCRVEKFANFTIALVSDGAGSCANSHIGSKQACDFGLYRFEHEIKKHHWDQQGHLPSLAQWHEVAKHVMAGIREDLENYSMNNELEFKSLSCTLLVAILLPSALLFTHIGDGRAGFCNPQNEWFPIMTPFHGQEANETVFITSDIWDDSIVDFYTESTIVQEPIKAFCLMSDGCEKAAFECNLYDPEKEVYYDPNRPFKDFFQKNIDKHLPHMHATGKTQDEINALWETFLTSGNEKLRQETDDKTMVLAVQLTPPSIL